MKVLIIEDEYSLADAISETLNKEGFSVKVETDGEKGEDEAIANVYDIILLDVMLPHKDGFSILKKLRREKIETPVIMLTAKSEIYDKLNGLKNGADDYITKPFHMKELVARIKVILKRNSDLDDTDNMKFGDLTLDLKTGKMKAEIQEYIKSENEKVNTHIKNVIIFSCIASGLALIAIYVVSKNVAKIIVKPVEDTLEKQKQFISDASHELKTPLAVIEANADVLENEVGDNKWLTYIQNETDSMDKLINELLLLAKMENVDDIKSYEIFDVSNQIEMCAYVFESMAYEKKVKIKTNIQKDIKLNGNKQDIEHIVSTLLDNAIKHSEEGKDVSVEVIKEKNNIVLQIKNHGEPIPENQKDKIFERFYRVDKARNRNEKRYGLGLAIAKSTVLKYKGKIEVECKEGVTCFKVIIPIRD